MQVRRSATLREAPRGVEIAGSLGVDCVTSERPVELIHGPMEYFVAAEVSNKSLQMIAVADIGHWVARAFGDPATFIGKAEEIAGDELTRAQIVSALRRHGLFAGLPFPVPRLLLRPLPADVRRMFEWFGESGYAADIPALRARHPRPMTLEDWLSAPRASCLFGASRSRYDWPFRHPRRSGARFCAAHLLRCAASEAILGRGSSPGCRGERATAGYNRADTRHG